MNFLKPRVEQIKLFFRAFSILLALFLVATNAIADEFDTVNFMASSTYVRDSNLFRLPAHAQPSAPGAERADNIYRNSVGISINKPYSLQVFKFDYAYVDTKYDNADFLDFKASNYKAAWEWALTPSLTGVLSKDRIVSLVPFQDLRSTTASQTKNVRTKETQIFSFDFSPHNTLHFIGGYNKLDVKNSKTFLPETSYKLDTINAGIKYVFPSASYISFVSSVSDGQNQEINFTQQVGKGFKQKQQSLSMLWLATGKSRVGAELGYLDVVDDTFSTRDFSGIYGNVNYIWDITGKTTLSMGLARKLSSFQTSFDTYTVSDTLFFSPIWHATSKITVRANTQFGHRDFKGEGPLVSTVDRKDNVFSYGVGVDWAPRSVVQFGLNLQHDEINSNFKNVESSDNTISLNGKLMF